MGCIYCLDIETKKIHIGFYCYSTYIDDVYICEIHVAFQVSEKVLTPIEIKPCTLNIDHMYDNYTYLL